MINVTAHDTPQSIAQLLGSKRKPLTKDALKPARKPFTVTEAMIDRYIAGMDSDITRAEARKILEGRNGS